MRTVKFQAQWTTGVGQKSKMWHLQLDHQTLMKAILDGWGEESG